MAMNGNTLGDALAAAVAALSNADKADPTICWRTIANAMVAHITANATVTIKTTDGSLQTTTTNGVATNAPASNKTLPAGCIA